MAKKRKVSSRRDEDGTGQSVDIGQARKRIRDYEDVAGSDDEFHINRDKVLLDEAPEAKRRRKWQEEDEFLQPSDKEVLGYSDEEEDEDTGAFANGGAVQLDQDVDDAPSESSGAGDDDEEEGVGWAMSKGEIYGADEIETEEQALEEEAEALRLQRKQLQALSAADYGFDESEWQEGGKGLVVDEGDQDNVVTEVLPQLQLDDCMSPVERYKLLPLRYPEFEPLAKELSSLRELHSGLSSYLETKDSKSLTEHHPNAATKFRAASVYLGALTMYFTILSSPASKDQGALAVSAAKLRDHPLMDSLVKGRQLWSRAKVLPEDPKPVLQTSDAGGSLVEALDNQEEPQLSKAQRRSTNKTRAQRHAEAVQAAAETRRAERMQKTQSDLADLNVLLGSSAGRKSSKKRRQAVAANDRQSDVDEEAPMTAQEAAEKAKRKKTLRFYTSQIAQKANKRGTAGRNAGGDEDIPYRERLRDRQARLNAEAEKRGQRNGNPRAELGDESDEEDMRQAQEIRAGDNEGDYYDLVASKVARKKAEKAAFAEAQRQAALQGGQVVQEESVGADGKRKITYAIEKNKGLAPHRKKEVRNPRVKKRKKFDEKKKKLASIKPVYKGGEGRGGYKGELTGIKKGLVKSTKL